MDMKRLLFVVASCLMAISSYAANPSFMDFFGTNGIVIRTNGNKVQVDGAALVGGDAGGTNSRQGGTLVGTNLVNNPNVVTNILGAGTVTVASNNAGTFTITGSGGGTNTLVQTNGVNLGSAGTVNFSPGVTGYLAGAVANLGVNVSGAVGGGSSLWTNVDNGHVMLRDGDTNSLRVSTNGLFGIAIGDTNALKEYGWPATTGHTYLSFLDGSAGHKVNTWVHGINDVPGQLAVVASMTAGTDPTIEASLAFQVTDNDAGLATGMVLTARDTDAYLTLTDLIDDSVISIEAGGDVFGNQSMIYARWQAQTRFLLHTNGSLTLGATTNHITFGTTNAPPASAVAPTKWVSVLINGEATQYKIPLYQ